MSAILIISTMLQVNGGGKPYTALIEFGIAFFIDQGKNVPMQFFLWWIVIRRCGKFEAGEFEVWDDEEIANNGEETSLMQTLRNAVKSFLEAPLIAGTILVMTLLLCAVIFTELSFSDNITREDESGKTVDTTLGQIFFVINYFLLSFFIGEITLKLFAYGFEFLSEFINVFDSVVVIISFVFQILGGGLRAVGVLRMARLIKVLVELRRVSLAKKALQEEIKQKKKQGSQMASYVERLIDFLEKQMVNDDLPNTLQEDIEWAAGVISANKLYKGSLSDMKFDENRPEIKAWLGMINMTQVPLNIEEMKHRREFEDLHKLENQRKGKRPEKKAETGDLESTGKGQKFDPESSQAILIPKKVEAPPVRDSKITEMKKAGTKSMKMGSQPQTTEMDADNEFL